LLVYNPDNRITAS
jgi:hypothetical protein